MSIRKNYSKNGKTGKYCNKTQKKCFKLQSVKKTFPSDILTITFSLFLLIILLFFAFVLPGDLANQYLFTRQTGKAIHSIFMMKGLGMGRA